MSSDFSPRFVQQFLPNNLHSHHNTEGYRRRMKTLYHFWRCIFPTLHHLHSKWKCLKPQWARQSWMVLALTLRQLLAVNCVACKRSVLTLASRIWFTNFVRYEVLRFFYDSHAHWLYHTCGVVRQKFQLDISQI
jgi:hypothetical protein